MSNLKNLIMDPKNKILAYFNDKKINKMYCVFEYPYCDTNKQRYISLKEIDEQSILPNNDLEILTKDQHSSDIMKGIKYYQECKLSLLFDGLNFLILKYLVTVSIVISVMEKIKNDEDIGGLAVAMAVFAYLGTKKPDHKKIRMEG